MNVFRSLGCLRRGVRAGLGLPKGEGGFSMVEALTALGIGAVGWMAIVQLSESNMRLQKANSLTIDRDTLRATIMAKLHCPNSVSQTFVDACKAG
jgi:Tfp pilus assembly protein PilV